MTENKPSRMRWLVGHLLLGGAAATYAACGASNAPEPSAPQAGAMERAATAQPGSPPPPPVGAMPAALAAPEPAPAADEPAAQPRPAMAIAGGEAKPEAPQYAPVREFPVPSYVEGYEGPRNDFRETIFWKPSVRTDERGKAEVRFFMSDAITSFRATAQGVSGGVLGRGESLLVSKLPVSLTAKLPVEVSRGDTIELPITLANTTGKARVAKLSAAFGAAFETKDTAARDVRIAAKSNETVYYTLRVKDAANGGKVDVSATSGSLSDALSREIRVAPSGFPREVSKSGTLGASVTDEIDISDAAAGTVEAKLAFYPSPTATLIAGTEQMLREPGGCFEQASSSNYPNVMVLAYLKENNKADSEVMTRAETMLDRGYKLLSGYETKSRGYEWFGGDPGHEALTAYGLMEFVDMAKVYKDVDPQMVERTRVWLRARRDGRGGYQRNSRALDSFGQATEDVTNAYITFALTEAGEKDLAPEIEAAKKAADSAKDPYVLALVANTLLNADKNGKEAKTAVERLAKMQKPEGHFPGASQSITRSGGQALDIETTSLATLAMMKSDGRASEAQKGVDWISKQGSGGMYGSTQSTILALKALSRAASGSRTPPSGTITVTVNGGPARTLTLDPQKSNALSLDLSGDFKVGKNTVVVSSTASGKLPYGITVNYSVSKLPSSPKSPVKLTTGLSSTAVKAGEAVKLRTTVANGTAAGIPMVVALIGIPGGTQFQTWQLDELKNKGLVDYYETRERQVIVYFRSMGPNAKKTFDIDLLSTVPGSFTAPASSAYLYYTDEHKTFANPVQLRVNR